MESRKNVTKELIYKTDSQTQKNELMVTKGEKGRNKLGI